MKRILSKLLLCIIIMCSCFAVFSQTSSALSWDGSSQGGGGGWSYASANGYAIATTDDNCIAYRFSVVDKNGDNKVAKVIDVFRNTNGGNDAYGTSYKFTGKYNKKQLQNNQNSGFSTSRNTTSCYKETDMGFSTWLPAPGGIGTWQNNQNNLNSVLRSLGISGGINSLKNGDKVLVEPLYYVRLQSIWHSVTTTEIALYGKYILGVWSDGGWSYTSETWGFISSYTNKYYPNELYTPDGQGLWSGVGALANQASFYTIINSGFGVGIAYTETRPDFTPTLSVNLCEAWPGAKSTRKSNHYGISYGSTFANWTYGHSYPIMGDSIWYALYFPAESENCYVRQSVWVVGGGSISRNVWSNSNTWYDVALSPTTVASSASYYTVKARVDWLDGNGNVQKWGAEKTFYIPIRPKIHQYQVTMYSVSGAVAAYDGEAGSSGSVYYGQRVYPKYTFTSDNTWTSANNFGGTMYEWKSGKWTELWDMQSNNIGINKNSAYNKYSSKYPYTVPDNSTNTNGANRIPVLFASEWVSDPSHTYANKWVDIPIVKADAEITSIRLIDEDGYYLDPTDLEAGQQVTVQYTYKNNTSCTIYVNGYNDNKSQIPGIYAIEPGRSINVNGYSFEVPNKRTFYIWGGVYLESAGIYNTMYETDGMNNTMLLVCKVNHPLRIYPIAPNASYREDTAVVASFWVQNGYRDDYVLSDNISARFKIMKADGTIIDEITVSNIVVPGNDKNLVYFKWYVPTGLNYSNIKITASIIDCGVSYNSYTRSYSTIPYTLSETPDTQFEKSAPAGFVKPADPTASSGNATWWEYKYENGKFVKHNYAVGIYNLNTKEIIPATGETATKNGSQWTMKSGYGISLKAYKAMVYLSGYEYAPSSSYTGVQYAYASFPEYSYSASAGNCRTLDTSGSYFVFRQNRSYGRVHFTSLWYPDGNYTVKVVKRDAWTPSGMLTASVITNSITISGSAYDDWYISRK